MQTDYVGVCIFFGICYSFYRFNQKSELSMSDTKMTERDELSYDMRIVSSARFAMARRFETAANIKRFLINGLSAISIFLSAALLAANRNIPVNTIALYLIGISIFIMWMSLDRSSGELFRDAESVRKCAEEVSTLRRKLDAGLTSVQETTEAYTSVISSFNLNHHNTDRRYARYEARTKFPEKIKGESFLASALPYYTMRFWYLLLFAIWAAAIYAVSVNFLT